MARLEAMHDPKQYITEEQALKAIEATTNLRDEILLKLLWHTGARVTEIITITQSNINVKDRFITISSLKKKEEAFRDVPVPDQLIKDIESFIKRGGTSGSEYLFTADGKRPITRQAAYAIVRAACEKSGMKSVGDPRITTRGLHPHPHSFRHGFAMNWFKRGGRAEPLQEILGHNSYETTRSYQRFTSIDLKKEYDKTLAKP